MFRPKSATKIWVAAAQRQLEQEEAGLAAEIARFEQELEAAPALIQREISALRKLQAERAGIIEPARLNSGAIRDIRQGRQAGSPQSLRPPGKTRAQRRRARLRAMAEFVILAAILAVCLMAAASMSAGGR